LALEAEKNLGSRKWSNHLLTVVDLNVWWHTQNACEFIRLSIAQH